MIKRFYLLALLIAVSNVNARDIYNPDVTIYAIVGTCKPLEPGDFENFWSTGGNFSFGLGYQHFPGLKTGLYFRYYVFPDNKNRIAERAYSEGATTFTDPEPVSFPTAAIFLHIDMTPVIKIFKPYFHFEMGLSRHKLNEVYAIDSSGSWFLISPFSEETYSFFAYGFGLEIKATNWMNLFGEIRYVDTMKRRRNVRYLAVNIGVVLPFRVF